MTDIEALITTARRYCIDNHKYWADKYSKERTGNDFPYTYTDNDYNLFPRYIVLEAILQGVETLVGQSFSSFDSCKQELKHAGQNSQTIFTTSKQNPVQEKAMQDERNKFIRFVDSVTNLDSVAPLPHRRKLKESEALQIRQHLLDSWNYDGSYWEPIGNKSPKETVFLMKDNFTDSDVEKIIQFVQQKADSKLFLITEDKNDYEIENSIFSPDLYETICCDKSYDWVVYGSHESTISFGGSSLTQFIRQLFADRQDKINKWADWGQTN